MTTASRFEVSTEGLRQLQSMRQPWQLAKELVSNCFDEDATEVKVEVYRADDVYVLDVQDNGPGFANIADAWTLYGPTRKRSDPKVRGRFNIGEKELLSVAVSGMVVTTTGMVLFPAEGGRKFDPGVRKDDGTLVQAAFDWTDGQALQVSEKLKALIPPAGVLYTVNGDVVSPREVLREFSTRLPTVLMDDGLMRRTVRLTSVWLYRVDDGETPMLYELGIPVQPLTCPWHVDVQQKVPMNPNRDGVSDEYLRTVYAEVLNVMADTLGEDQVSETWVRQGTESARARPEAVVSVHRQRYGDRTVIRSADGEANEKAREAGYAVVDQRHLSFREREVLKEVGVVHAAQMFGQDMGDAKPAEITPGMERTAELVRRISRELLHYEVRSEFVYTGASVNAWWSGGTIRFNARTLGAARFDSPMGLLWLIAHELAHDGEKDEGPHDYKFLDRLAMMAEKLTLLALRNQEVFDV